MSPALASVAALARVRWKIENANNNTIRTKGYHLEHKLGHGRKHLAAVFPSCRTFFGLVRTPTLDNHFTGWRELVDFMMRGLEQGPYVKTVCPRNPTVRGAPAWPESLLRPDPDAACRSRRASSVHAPILALASFFQNENRLDRLIIA